MKELDLDELCRRLMEEMLEGCQVISFDWKYLYVNSAIVTQDKNAKEKLLGHTMMEMYPGIEKTEMFKTLQECMKNRIPQKILNEFTFPDGSIKWFEFHFQPVLEGVFILSMDVTEHEKIAEDLRKKEEEKKEQFKTLLSSLAFASNKLAVGKNDVHIQVDLLFEAFEHLFKHTNIEFHKCVEPLEAVKQATDWLVKNSLVKEGQLLVEKTGKEIMLNTLSLCAFGESCKCLNEENVKINCPLGLLLLYFIKKCTGEYGFLVNTEKFSESGCSISLEPVYGD